MRQAQPIPQHANLGQPSAMQRLRREHRPARRGRSATPVTPAAAGTSQEHARWRDGRRNAWHLQTAEAVLALHHAPAGDEAAAASARRHGLINGRVTIPGLRPYSRYRSDSPPLEREATLPLVLRVARLWWVAGQMTSSTRRYSAARKGSSWLSGGIPATATGKPLPVMSVTLNLATPSRPNEGGLHASFPGQQNQVNADWVICAHPALLDPPGHRLLILGGIAAHPAQVRLQAGDDLRIG
jgi:hypothetical protein